MPKANAENTNSRKTKHVKAVSAVKAPSVRNVADPIYAAIDRHVAAYKKHMAAISACGRAGAAAAGWHLTAWFARIWLRLS